MSMSIVRVSGLSVHAVLIISQLQHHACFGFESHVIFSSSAHVHNPEFVIASLTFPSDLWLLLNLLLS